MAVPKKTVEIHGVRVEQTQLSGNWYTPVDERVKIAEQADPAKVRRQGAGYHVLCVQFVQIGDRWAYHCLVEYPAGSGVVTPGTDFIDTKDAAGVAKAETSAIGRALGLHGIAIEQSIASAEEMARTDGAESEATEEQWQRLRRGCAALNRQPPRGPLSEAQARDILAQLEDDYRKAHPQAQNGNGADLRQLPTGTSRP